MDALWTRISEGERLGFDVLKTALEPTLPLLGALADTPQDPEWHAEGDVATHTAMVLGALDDELDGCAAESRLALVLGALLHDIAKPLTTRTADVGGRERVIAPRHAKRGRSWLLPRLLEPSLGLPRAAVETIVALVGHHHDPREVVRAARIDDRRAVGAAWSLARRVEPDLLLRLERADIRGRICPDADVLLADLDSVALAFAEADEGLPSPDALEHEMASALPFRDDALLPLSLARARRAVADGRIASAGEALAMTWRLRDRPIPRLVLTVGCSGSGKSSWVEAQTAADDGPAVVSMDALRRELTGKRHDQSANGHVLAAAREATRVALRARRSVIFDATSLRRDGRAWFRKLADDYDASFELAVFPRPVSLLETRNQTRAERVPAKVLRQQVARVEWPTVDECDVLSWHYE